MAPAVRCFVARRSSSGLWPSFAFAFVVKFRICGGGRQCSLACMFVRCNTNAVRANDVHPAPCPLNISRCLPYVRNDSHRRRLFVGSNKRRWWRLLAQSRARFTFRFRLQRSLCRIQDTGDQTTDEAGPVTQARQRKGRWRSRWVDHITWVFLRPRHTPQSTHAPTFT